ncbi:hypothetical protein BHE74_00008309 [Ensete ventricosum]|nr:hypothetical protein GW17_00000200 [Ensete ventricosum]RWW83191.1 hypothetical protein BHE74_00008309 [Ensete ventricosum]
MQGPLRGAVACKHNLEGRLSATKAASIGGTYWQRARGRPPTSRLVPAYRGGVCGHNAHRGDACMQHHRCTRAAITIAGRGKGL